MWGGNVLTRVYVSVHRRVPTLVGEGRVPTLVGEGGGVITLARGYLLWVRGLPISGSGYLPSPRGYLPWPGGGGVPQLGGTYLDGDTFQVKVCTPLPSQGRYPQETEQHSEFLLRRGRYASCVYAGGLICEEWHPWLWTKLKRYQATNWSC